MFDQILLGVELVFAVLVGLFLLYVGTRLVTLAYFHSRMDYEAIIVRKRLCARNNHQLEGV